MPLPTKGEFPDGTVHPNSELGLFSVFFGLPGEISFEPKNGTMEARARPYGRNPNLCQVE